MTFHQDRPDHLFSCSSSGESWHWDTSAVSRSARPGQSMPWTGQKLTLVFTYLQIMNSAYKQTNFFK